MTTIEERMKMDASRLTKAERRKLMPKTIETLKWFADEFEAFNSIEATENGYFYVWFREN